MKKQLQSIVDLLERNGATTSKEVQTALQISQSSASRYFQDLEDEICAIGTGKSTRYAVAKSIGTLRAQQPVSLVLESGQVAALGTLTHLAKSQLLLQSTTTNAVFETTPTQPLPWLISGLRPQGFLGRLVTQKFAHLGYPAEPEAWQTEEILFSATTIQDTPGAVILGPISSIQPDPFTQISAQDPGAALDQLALVIANTLPAGSSAGGEQPKVLVHDEHGDSFVVKFSAPRGTPFGDRWSDLLITESIGAITLAEFGLQAAETRIVQTPARTYLLSKRFDRSANLGRRHIVSIGAAHLGFVKGAYINWADTAFQLSQKGRLPKADAAQAQALLHFGHLIGNTDMHSGNVSLFVLGSDLEELLAGQFSLAPAYDMLPMVWKPNPMLGIYPYQVFQPDFSACNVEVRKAAQVFWTKVAADPRISLDLKAVAIEMTHRVGV